MPVWVLTGLSSLGVLLSAALPWLQFRPNRIVEGTVRYLGFQDAGWGAVVAALWLAPLAFLLVNRKTALRAAWVVCQLVPAVLLFGAGAVAAGLVPAESFARVSPSWGFWLSLLLAYGGSLVLAPLTGLPKGWTSAGAFLFPVVCAVGLATGSFQGLSLLREYAAQPDVFWADVVTHLTLAGAAVAAGTLVGVGTGWASYRLVRFRKVAFVVLNVVQTVPSLALFGLLIVPLAALGWGGIGNTTALVALSMHAAFPIARSTLTALDHLDAAVLDAGRGLGMGKAQLLARVQIPLALPVVLEGVRTASVQAVGNTVVAALIGAGGLGSLVFIGLGQYAPDLILLGTLPVVALALGLDLAWSGVLRLLPKGTR